MSSLRWVSCIEDNIIWLNYLAKRRRHFDNTFLKDLLIGVIDSLTLLF